MVTDHVRQSWKPKCTQTIQNQEQLVRQDLLPLMKIPVLPASFPCSITSISCFSCSYFPLFLRSFSFLKFHLPIHVFVWFPTEIFVLNTKTLKSIVPRKIHGKRSDFAKEEVINSLPLLSTESFNTLIPYLSPTNDWNYIT